MQHYGAQVICNVLAAGVDRAGFEDLIKRGNSTAPLPLFSSYAMFEMMTIGVLELALLAFTKQLPVDL